MTDTQLAERADQSRRTPIDTSKVIGWGVDADPQNDPTYPYRDRSRDEGLTLKWDRPAQQQSHVEVLQSVEYAHFPAVFGTAAPPRGLSGMIRRGAFRYSESHWLHWLMLLGADRIDMVEGLVDDLMRAKIPNIPREMGIGAEWKHNKKGLAAKVAVAAAIGGAVFAWSRMRGGKGKDRRGRAGTPARRTSARAAPDRDRLGRIRRSLPGAPDP